MPHDDEPPSGTSCTACSKQQCDLENGQLRRCARCRAVWYCSKECQAGDWGAHKAACKRPNYTIEVQLCKGQIVDPPVRRVLSCPAAATFQQLHEALQIAFEWSNYYNWDFVVLDPAYREPADFLWNYIRQSERFDRAAMAGRDWAGDASEPRQFLVRVKPPDVSGVRPRKHHDYEGNQRRRHPRTPGMNALRTRLHHVFDDAAYAGKGWAYTYDFGDEWVHHVGVVGRTAPEAEDRFRVLDGEGGGAAEDAGGWQGWEELKEAYRAQAPTEEQRSKMEWYGMRASNADVEELRGVRAKRWSVSEVNRRLAEAAL